MVCFCATNFDPFFVFSDIIILYYLYIICLGQLKVTSFDVAAQKIMCISLGYKLRSFVIIVANQECCFSGISGTVILSFAIHRSTHALE